MPAINNAINSQQNTIIESVMRKRMKYIINQNSSTHNARLSVKTQISPKTNHTPKKRRTTHIYIADSRAATTARPESTVRHFAADLKWRGKPNFRGWHHCAEQLSSFPIAIYLYVDFNAWISDMLYVRARALEIGSGARAAMVERRPWARTCVREAFGGGRGAPKGAQARRVRTSALVHGGAGGSRARSRDGSSQRRTSARDDGARHTGGSRGAGAARVLKVAAARGRSKTAGLRASCARSFDGVSFFGYLYIYLCYLGILYGYVIWVFIYLYLFMYLYIV